ncbi:MAG: flagellar motor switch protein FliM [Thermodesulfobacteriota bacterium]
MSKLLSQDEVDALLKGLDTGDIESEQKPAEAESVLESFDWASLGRNVRGSMPLLEVVNSRFCQRVRASLSSVLRKLMDISPEPVETIKFSEFQRSLPVPTSMHLFKLEPLRGTGILVIESRLVFCLVEAFFGGSGMGSTKIEGRDFTPIEKKVIEKVVQMALVNLTESWEEVYPIKTEFIRSESNPLAVNVVPPEELLISAKFDVELNKPLGKIMVCTPISSFQPIRQKLAGGYLDDDAKLDETWVNCIRDRLMPILVEMKVDLGRTTLSVKELQNLRPGDIIVLDNSFRDPIRAFVEGVHKYEGYAGRVRNRKVFKVEQPVQVGP